MANKLYVHHTFGHEGVSYNNDNINELPKDQIAKRIKSGHISEIEAEDRPVQTAKKEG